MEKCALTEERIKDLTNEQNKTKMQQNLPKPLLIPLTLYTTVMHNVLIRAQTLREKLILLAHIQKNLV